MPRTSLPSVRLNMKAVQNRNNVQGRQMLKKLIIIAAIVLVPLAFYLALKNGTVEETTFASANMMAMTSESEDQAKKVGIVSVISGVGAEGEKLTCIDSQNATFQVDFTGSEPHSPFTTGMRVKFIGHVHGGESPYFHATQVFPE